MIKWLTFFARFYSPLKFIAFIKVAGKKIKFLPRLMMIYYCIKDPDTPKFVRLVLMGAIGYHAFGYYSRYDSGNRMVG